MSANLKKNHKNCHFFSCRYVCGQAEIVFKELDSFLLNSMHIETPQLLGVLDPPRAGLSDKVIRSCRMLERLRRLVYVSCDPKAALKNVVDLCRPMSNKYAGNPFRVVRIQPVDMFPQTIHLEWAILLVR